jgi:hypothetical protein
MRFDFRMVAAAAAVCTGIGGALLTQGDGPEPLIAAEVPADTPVAVSPAPPSGAAPTALRAARAVLDGVGVPSGVAASRTASALEVLGPHVSRQSDPAALRTAFLAYFNFQAANPDRVRKPYLYFVDYGLDARTPRGYVFDMNALAVVEGPFTVAHGRGSAPTASGIPTRFSNRHGSNATSLGLYLAQETYSFSGRSGGRTYRSVGLRLAGLSGAYNSAARTRGVVVHGAPYVTAALAGRSEGCPAMEQARASRLLPRIANGGMVFHFSPRDRGWLERDPWINRG